jgi:hypothetical protein
MSLADVLRGLFSASRGEQRLGGVLLIGGRGDELVRTSRLIAELSPNPQPSPASAPGRLQLTP